MRESHPLFAFSATVMVAFFLIAAILIVPDFATAAEQPALPATGARNPAAPAAAPLTPIPSKPAPSAKDEDQATSCSCPDAMDKSKVWPRPKFAEMRRPLDARDEIAALESVHLALAEVGDGSSYVWHRYDGRLSGVVTPTASFRDSDGNVCRHLIVILSAGTHSKRTEGVACRLDSGRWQLQG